MIHQQPSFTSKDLPIRRSRTVSLVALHPSRNTILRPGNTAGPGNLLEALNGALPPPPLSRAHLSLGHDNENSTRLKNRDPLIQILNEALNILQDEPFMSKRNCNNSEQ